jgi:hypothetical protein
VICEPRRYFSVPRWYVYGRVDAVDDVAPCCGSIPFVLVPVLMHVIKDL